MLGRTSCAAAKRLQRAPIGATRTAGVAAAETGEHERRSHLDLNCAHAGTFVGTLRAVPCRSLPLCVPSSGPWARCRSEKASLKQPLSEGTWERLFPCPCADRAFGRRGGGGRRDAADGRRRPPGALALKPFRRRIQAQCARDRLSVAVAVQNFKFRAPPGNWLNLANSARAVSTRRSVSVALGRAFSGANAVLGSKAAGEVLDALLEISVGLGASVEGH